LNKPFFEFSVQFSEVCTPADFFGENPTLLISPCNFITTTKNPNVSLLNYHQGTHGSEVVPKTLRKPKVPFLTTPPKQQSLRMGPTEASSSALDFLWAVACIAAAQNPASDFFADQGGTGCVDRADPFAADWGAWPPTKRRAVDATCLGMVGGFGGI
jgi:hypothetical protein